MGGLLTYEELEYINSSRVRVSEQALNRAFALFEIEERAPVIEAVCDAIEGFCADTCEWAITSTSSSVYTGETTHHRITACQPDRNAPWWKCGVCPHCDRRVIERFEILEGGEG